MRFDDLELMLFHDGELDGEQERRIRAARLHSPELGRRLEALALLGNAARGWAAQNGMERDAERKRLSSRARRRTALASAAAVVAVLAFARLGAPELDEVAESPELEATSVVAVSYAAPPPEGLSVAVTSVDFGARDGAIFVVEAGLAATTVVWLPDLPEASRIGTL